MEGSGGVEVVYLARLVEERVPERVDVQWVAPKSNTNLKVASTGVGGTEAAAPESAAEGLGLVDE